MGAIGINFNNRVKRESIAGLSIVLYPDGLYYGSWNKDNVLIRAERQDRSDNLYQQIKAIAEENRNPPLKIVLATIPFLHIPSKLFSIKKASSFFEDIYPKRLIEDQNFNNDLIEDLKINTSYFTPKDMGKRYMKNSQHFSTVLTKTFVDDQKLMAFIDGNNLIICYIKEGSLHFYNQYNCRFPEDFLYYIMLAYNEFNLNTDDTDLFLSGRVSKSSNIVKTLKQYLNVKYLKFNKDHFRTEDLPQHFYHDLYLSWLCE